MELAETGATWRLHLDRWITRRKRFHVVIDDENEVQFKSRIVGECLLYLAAEGIDCYVVTADPVKDQEIPPHQVTRREPVKWQN